VTPLFFSNNCNNDSRIRAESIDEFPHHPPGRIAGPVPFWKKFVKVLKISLTEGKKAVY
jgi:hypothetical protein